ncbi:MAG: tyrosine-type recombinase/integrase, partial [Planctomycetota bacterium]
MHRVPKIGRHSTGQARVTLSGQVHYLGAYGTQEAAAKYAELLAKWEAGGRQPLRPVATVAQVGTVAELVAEYLRHVDRRGRYTKSDGRRTSAHARLDRTLRYVVKAIGDVQLRRLRPAHLRKWIDEMIDREGVGRDYLNKMLATVRAMLEWAAREERLGRDQFRDLREVESLSREDLPGRDHRVEKYCPTAAEVERIAQAAGGIVGRMIRVQFACGLRPGELLRMRWCDLDRTEVAGCWTYRVSDDVSKVAHHGRALTYAVPASLLDGLVPTAPAARVFEGGPRSREVYNSALRRACKA